MPDLTCPCGHLVSAHKRLPDFVGCLDFVGVTNGFGETEAESCECDLSPFEALRAAQRKAAIEKLRHMFKQRDSFDKKSVGYDRWDNAAWMVLGAYRAVGILGQRKGGE